MHELRPRLNAMSFEQLKREVALLNDQQQAELISYALQLRSAQNSSVNDANKSHWLTPDEFEGRLDDTQT